MLSMHYIQYSEQHNKKLDIILQSSPHLGLCSVTNTKSKDFENGVTNVFVFLCVSLDRPRARGGAPPPSCTRALKPMSFLRVICDKKSIWIYIGQILESLNGKHLKF